MGAIGERHREFLVEVEEVLFELALFRLAVAASVVYA